MSEEAPSGQAAQPTIQFDYIKSPQFRVIHADGVIGGVTPSGLIHMALYSERTAIPKVLRHALLPDQSLGPIVESEGRSAIVREMDVDALLTPAAAHSLMVWLQDRLTEFQALQSLGKSE